MPSSMHSSGVFLRSKVLITALPAGMKSPRADLSVKWSHCGTCLKNSWRVRVCESSQGAVVLNDLAAYFHGLPPIRGGEGGQFQGRVDGPACGE